MNHSIYEQLELHEGKEEKPYKDTEGFWTIGVGHNLDAKGLSEEVIKMILVEDVHEVIEKLVEYSWFNNLDAVRKKVIIDMAFNLGLSGLLSFKNMIQAIKDRDYIKAEKEMKDSKWYNQVKTRADRLCKMMKTGEDYKI